MPNWKEHAKSDLREYEAVKNSIGNIESQIREINAQMVTLKAQKVDSEPVQGGTSHKETVLIGHIDKKTRLAENYKAAHKKLSRIETGLSLLNERERRILDLFYIDRQKGHVERLCEEFNLEKSQIYLLCEDALKKFTISMYGVVDL